ncbi:Uncharacterized protein ToN1_16980 [Aromatoleum petrolei]|nr:Uncharacterized protein ToN1_16980 [Aromatoleum petrolei]
MGIWWDRFGKAGSLACRPQAPAGDAATTRLISREHRACGPGTCDLPSGRTPTTASP